MFNLGKRIVVVGVSACGKSTFTRKLALKTRLPVIFMDEIMWKPDWQYIGDDETVKKVDEVSGAAEWIIEGYIPTGAHTFLFERASTIIYLDYSPLISSWRYIKRWWKHRTYPRPELAGCPEKFSFKFLKIIWAKREVVDLNKSLAQIKDQNKIIILNSPGESTTLLKNI